MDQIIIGAALFVLYMFYYLWCYSEFVFNRLDSKIIETKNKNRNRYDIVFDELERCKEELANEKESRVGN
jgi:hypothetical protein